MSKHDRYGSTIVAIIAHEFGHIWAMRSGMMDKLNEGQSTVRRSELHADFLAGHFLGTKKKADKQISLQAAGDLFHRIGDYNKNAHNHHGTPEERVAAAEEGFKISYQQGREATYAFKAGMDYIKQV